MDCGREEMRRADGIMFWMGPSQINTNSSSLLNEGRRVICEGYTRRIKMAAVRADYRTEMEDANRVVHLLEGMGGREFEFTFWKDFDGRHCGVHGMIR
ncbi:hypothetical protein AB6A40_006416 [Gnathostoma spinigerum]|uniref:Uncharacterized protein n=1 Tax=Gnathostoma spinigerum TaxID=75299 RepID=A0ABD6EKI3_9BILA